MTHTLNKREDPLNLGSGGWSSSTPLSSWSPRHRRRRGIPIYKRRQRYVHKDDHEPPRKQPKQHHGQGPWFQAPALPYWPMCSQWEPWGGPWHPPPVEFWKPPGRVQMIRVNGQYPFCLCCCSCWGRTPNPAWPRPYGYRRRLGRRGRGLRRHPRRSFQRSQPVDVRMMMRPFKLHEWREPGLRAPKNTTQYIMNQVYEDMRQQEKLERQQAALRAQQVPTGGEASPAAASADHAPSSGGEEDPEPQKPLYSFLQSPSLGFCPAPEEGTQAPIPQQGDGEEEETKDGEEECEEEDEETEGEDGEYGESGEEEGENAEGDEVEGQDAGEEDEDEDGEDGEGEAEGKEVEETDYEEEKEDEETMEEEEEGLYDQRGAENHFPLGMPFSILVGSEEEPENLINYNYFSPKEINAELSQETLLMVQDTNY